MVSFIDEHRAQYGVEPICEQLPIAPSVYYEAKARQSDPALVPARIRRDAVLVGEIERVHKAISTSTERARSGANYGVTTSSPLAVRSSA